MIKFCNEILKARKESQDGDPAAGQQFDNASIIAARPAYSAYLLKELDDEIAKHVPAYKDYLEVIKRIGSIHFSRARFDEEWLQRASIEGKSSERALEELFEFSVIGYLKSGGGGGGSKYIWRYHDPGARFDPVADTFRVHAGFKESLDLVYGGTKDGE